MNYMPVVMGDRHGGAGRAPVVNSVAEGLWVHNMANTTVGIAASVAARRENPRYPSNLAWESRLADEATSITVDNQRPRLTLASGRVRVFVPSAFRSRWRLRP